MYENCPHCHKPLKHITVNLFGKPYDVTCYGSCGCERSKLDGMDPDDPNRKYVRAGIEPKYLRMQVDTDGYEGSVMSGSSLYVVGPNGTGKTTFAANVARKLVDKGLSVLFRNSKQITEDLKASMNDQSTVNRLFGVDVLVIDDLGKEQPTDYVLSMLYLVIETRYGKMRPTVITSNFHRDELMTRWAEVDEATAEAMVSRLCDNTYTVEMDGRDWRTQ